MGAKDTGWRAADIEVVQLVSLGMASKEIATRCGVSETAVKKRLGRLMKRFRAQNRAALVRLALVEGMIR
jgi:DNA-binding CsgD family transcriptional regulator